MTAPALVLPTITCERGLGRLSARMCAGRWAIAAGRHPKVSTSTAATIKQSRCNGCPNGEQRFELGAHKENAPRVNVAGDPPRRKRRTLPVVVAPSIAPAADLMSVAALDPAEPSDETNGPAGKTAAAAVETNEPEEKPMRKATCEECSTEFNVKHDRGPMPKKCPSCKGAAGPKSATGGARRLARAPRPPLERAVVEPAHPTVLGGFRVRVRGVEVECATAQHVVELVEHLGGA